MRPLTAKRYSHLRRMEAHEVGRPHFRLRNALISMLGDYRAEPIWDGYFVAVGTPATRQVLFATPQNQNFTIAGGATFIKTLQTTSMLNAGQLPSPERYVVRSIAIYTDNSMEQTDVAQFLSQTVVDFFISKKSFFTVPLAGKLPAGGGAWAQQSGVTAATMIGVTGNGLPSEAGGGYPLTAPGINGSNPDGSDSFQQIDGVLIAQDQNFGIILDPTLAAHINAPGVGFTTGAAQDDPAGIGINAWVLLEGIHVVAVQ